MEFADAFLALTGNDPFPWQRELYRRFIDGPIPSSCNLPTGLGKTSVIPIWLIAFANSRKKSLLPRRLVYVVNRRTVVDQSTEEAKKLRHRLINPDQYEPRANALRQLAQALNPGTPGDPLAISTLRGKFADNREWSAEPSRPAVVVGTVDMIGSRLLFSGYGLGFKSKPLHAGFLGQDVLLVHDEAHLEPAFQKLIESIRDEQKKEPAPLGEHMRLNVMELTATSRGEGVTLKLEQPDYAHPEVKKRIEAKKAIHLHENKDKKKLADEIADLALSHRDSGRAVLVYVRKVDDVEKIVARLKKEKQEVQQLTGTLRGLERDQLVDDAIIARFLPPSNRSADIVPTQGTVHLVCTSAGEVGVNISADHLVCDLSTFESMAQRFGRVNRFGDRADTRIDIIHPKEFDEEKKLESRLRKTLDLLKQLDSNGSPKALGDLDANSRLAAFAPSPTLLPVSDILFDAWALTTIRGKLPGRPPVEPYLHGISDWEPPETHVAWREEVGIITGELLETYKPEDLLEDYALKPHELLRDNSSRVFDRLKRLKAAAHTPVWVVADDDSVTVTTLGELVEAGKDDLGNKTVLLPPSAGGLENGMLTSVSDTANDVADDWRDEKGNQRRVRSWDDDPQLDEKRKDMRLIRAPLDTRPDADEDEDEQSTKRRYWYWYELPKAGDGDGSKSNKKPVLWQVHTDDVVKNVTDLMERLPLADDMKRAIILAGRFHDLGKRRALFQKILGNFDLQKLLAKSGKKSGRVPEQYRHEFGSLLDVPDEGDFKALKDKPDLQELILHLIAVHHGRGRPHFPADEAFDPERSEAAAAELSREVPKRFARFQRKYGRWGLAYLESLLRAADYAASAKPSRFVEDEA